MRYLQKVFLILLIVILAFILVSCDNFKDVFKKDYDYSYNGLEEIEEVFWQIENEDFSGKVSYVFEQQGKSLCYIDYYKRPQTAQQKGVEYTRYRCNIDKFGFYNDYNNLYYIDYTHNTLSTNPQKIAKGHDAISKIETYGRIYLKKDGELAYNFINKKESIITDYNDQDVQTVEFVYSKIKELDSDEQITLRFNFHRKQKELVRYSFESYSEKYDKTTIIKVYITDRDKNTNASVFDLPSEDDGFTLLIEEE